MKFKDYQIRIWDNNDLDLLSNDIQCFIGSTHYGIQIDSLEETKQKEILTICSKLQKNFKELTEQLTKIQNERIQKNYIG